MKKSLRLIIAAIFCSFLAATALAVWHMEKPDERDREFSLMLAGRINDTIIDEILRPLLVARTMAHSTVLADWLAGESSHTQEENVAYMKNYLSELKKQFGYTAAFLVSDRTHCYYTYKGLNKIVNPLEDPHDMWYPTFLKKNAAYDIEADVDQVNNAQWTIFVNCRISAPDGTLLGVCGVGETMQELQRTLHAYEKHYGVKINLVDTNGLVQMSSNASAIQRLYLNNIKLDATNDTYSVLQDAKGFRISKYLKDLGWYLIVQTGDNNTVSKFLPLATWELGALLVFLLLFTVYAYFSEKDSIESKTATDTIDTLTNLPNRNYFTEAYGETGVFNTTRYKAIVVFDIDHFTSLSAEHDGDAIIRGVADVARRVFEEHGLILHWGGDTFLALLELDMSAALTHCKSLCALVKEDVHVTVSAGLARVMLVDSIKVNFYRTMQACYSAKAAGGDRVVLGGGY